MDASTNDAAKFTLTAVGATALFFFCLPAVLVLDLIILCEMIARKKVTSLFAIVATITICACLGYLWNFPLQLGIFAVAFFTLLPPVRVAMYVINKEPLWKGANGYYVSFLVAGTFPLVIVFYLAYSILTSF